MFEIIYFLFVGALLLLFFYMIFAAYLLAEANNGKAAVTVLGLAILLFILIKTFLL
jgi:hypothetical protein